MDHALFHFEIQDQVVARLIEDEFVLLDLAEGTYFGLNAVGSEMWIMLSEGKPVTEIIEGIASEYDVDRSVVEADIHELFGLLGEKGLVSSTLV